MKQFCLFLTALSTISLSSCYRPDRNRFTMLARSLVATGDRITDAEANLTAQGFRCDRKSFAPSIACTRDRGGFLYSCIEQIHLSLTPDNRINQVRSEIVCAGM